MTIPVIGFARSGLEVYFWLRLHACPQCGERDIGEPHSSYGLMSTPAGEFLGADIYVTCPRCAHQRSYEFYEADGFNRSEGQVALGHASPSTIISPQEFLRELRRTLADVPPEFEQLSDAEQDHIAAERGIAEDCALELLKFIPAGSTEIPDAAFGDDLGYKHEHAAELGRAYLEAKVVYLVDYLVRMRAASERAAAERVGPADKRRLPIPAFSLASIKLHEKWFFEGDVGENQPIIAHGADATEMKLSARTLSKATLDKVTLDRADLSYTRLDEANLNEVSLRGADLSNGSANGARFTHCQFTGAEATLFKVDRATFDFCDFTGASLARSVWSGAVATRCVFRGVDLRNARLDDALFVDCDFRDADFGVVEQGINTAQGARFVRCDLRDSKWEGRELDDVQFLACKLAGARGPARVIAITVDHADASTNADNSIIASADDVVRQLG
jgi:uncharacterized protein YjbI with pentapeptide repeats